MTLLSSLTNRLFAAMALLAVVSIGAATYYATSAVTAHAEGELRRGLEDAGVLVDQYRGELLDHFNLEARLVADLPRLKAGVFDNHPPTLKTLAEFYQKELGADFFLVKDAMGRDLWRIAAADRGGILQAVAVPIYIDESAPELFGTLSVGFSLDPARFKTLTKSEIVFALDGVIRASTMPREAWPALTPLLARPGLTPSVQLNGQDYIAATRTLSAHPTEAHGATSAPVAPPTAIILRSRTQRLAFLSEVHTTMLLMAVVAVLAATLASYKIARTVTRPLGTVTNAMRDMASTGDLTRRIHLSSDARWEDEDARLLASSFNSMTDSIARFQREAAQRERLSSLGRLSTVVAHEIRNPLMIIKTALHGLRRGEVTGDHVRTAVADIEEEVERLNRIVSEVLDFARPIRFELAPVDLNELATDAARAASAGGPGGAVRLDLAPDLPGLVTDGERLRLALVNVLTNARHAVDAAGTAEDPEAITLRTHLEQGRRVTIQITDHGAGISPGDLARIFDPFFTTRRTGTGLGLAITRNIIEGLGGSIMVSSTEGHGTDVRIDVPITR